MSTENHARHTMISADVYGKSCASYDDFCAFVVTMKIDAEQSYRKLVICSRSSISVLLSCLRIILRCFLYSR